MRRIRFPLILIAAVLIATTRAEVSAAESSPQDPGLDRQESTKAADRDATLERLLVEADPRQDADWPTEAFGTSASAVLERLATSLTARKLGKAERSGIFASDARVSTLRPRDLARAELVPGVMLSRVDSLTASSSEVNRALRRLLRPFRGVAEPRFDFKIIGVEVRPAAGPRTVVRYEAAGKRGAGLIQHTGHWQVDWTPADSLNGPRIVSISVQHLDELTTRASWFEDMTASLLPPAEELWETLQFGGDYWHGRIDGLGEPNLMGHQGIAVGDADGDGLEDLYVAMGTGLPNLLLRQQVDGTLAEVAAEAGVDWLDDTKGVLFADTDNDGDQDLLCAMGPVIVLGVNDGRGKFERFVGLRASTPAP